MMALRVIAVLLAFSSLVCKSDAETITCEAPSVLAGEKALITCNFHHDVGKLHETFAVHHYDRNNEFTEILNCNWIEGRLKCDIYPGYHFDEHVNNSLTLQMFSAAAENEGKYVCQSVSSIEADIVPCNFTLKGLIPNSTKHGDIHTHTSSIPYVEEAETDDESNAAAIAVPIILVAVIVGAGIAIFLLKRRLSQVIPPSCRRFLPCQECREGDERRKRSENKASSPGTQGKSTELEMGAHTEVDALLATADPDVRAEGLTPLHWACKNGPESLVKVLVEGGADVNATMKDGTTPILLACQKGQEALLEILLSSQKADIEVKDKRGLTPLHVALHNNQENITKMLLDAGADIEARGGGVTPLLWACKSGSKSLVKILLENGANTNAKGIKGITPLHLACLSNREDIAKMLLQAKADTEAKDSEGKTPLHYACESGSDSLVAALVESRADVNAVTKDGIRPILLACQKGQQAILTLLLFPKDSNIEAKDKDGMTPLLLACKNGDKSLFEMLIAKGANMNATDGNDWTPLHYACQQGSKEIVTRLLQNGANTKARTKKGLTPKDVAKRRCQTDIVTLLEELTTGKHIKAAKTGDKGTTAANIGPELDEND